jgi:hypothetical protein
VPGHIAAVKAVGAEAVRVILPDHATDNTNTTIETQYTFPSREILDCYFQIHAPALRADLLKHFPVATGIRFERQVSEITYEIA